MLFSLQPVKISVVKKVRHTTHPGHSLFEPLPSDTNILRNSFFSPQRCCLHHTLPCPTTEQTKADEKYSVDLKRDIKGTWQCALIIPL